MDLRTHEPISIHPRFQPKQQIKIQYSGREYHTMTLRALYDYVIRAITNTNRNRVQGYLTHRIRQSSIGGIEEVDAQTQPQPLAPVSPPLPLGTIPELHTPLRESSTNTLQSQSANERTRSARSVLTAENENGKHIKIGKRLGGYLHPRDMRRLVTPFSASNEPELMVRRHVMLLNVDPLRAIVLRDRLLVLVPDGADSILINLEKRVRGGIDEMEKQVFGEGTEISPESIVEVLDVLKDSGLLDNDVDLERYSGLSLDGSDNEEGGDDNENNVDASIAPDDGSNPDDIFDNEWDDFEGGDWIELPFELQSVDAVLSSAVKMLSEESLLLRKDIFHVMAEMRGDSSKRSRASVPGDHVQEKLRILKDKVREMEGRVQGFVRAINQILDEDEDMSLMNLSRLISHPDRFIQPVSQQILNEESDEPELILEAYLQQALSEVNALELLKGNIINTEELVTLQLDTVRNRLLYINTVVSVFSLCVASASLVGSIFGMNLINHMENDPNTFTEVVTGTLVGSTVMLVSVLWLISKTGVMPANPQRVLFSRRSVDIEARSSVPY